LFFALVFALSVPFWVIGMSSVWQLLPGLPIAALNFACPSLAAAWLVYRREGAGAVADLARRSFDYRRITAKLWLIPIFVLMPAVMVLSFAVMRFYDVPLPAPEIAVRLIAPLFGAFFVAGLGEELGWSGYALDPLQQRWGALGASLIIGCVWAVWHVVALLQAGRAGSWIAGWFLMTVALRVLHTWLYNNTGGSVLGAALFHASANMSWQLFPNRGSHYDPRITGLILAFIATLVVVVWGPRALRRHRNT